MPLQHRSRLRKICFSAARSSTLTAASPSASPAIADTALVMHRCRSGPHVDRESTVEIQGRRSARPRHLHLADAAREISRRDVERCCLCTDVVEVVSLVEEQYGAIQQLGLPLQPLNRLWPAVERRSLPRSCMRALTKAIAGIRTHANARTQARTHARTHACTHACTHARTHARMHARSCPR